MGYIHNNRFKPYELTSIEGKDGRVYKVPGGQLYESITTALGKNPEKKKSLQEWRERVGEREANKISSQAAKRGTAVHKIAENYLNNEPTYNWGFMPNIVSMFNDLKPHLDKNISEVYMQECPLFSHKYKLAGRTDCIAMWDGKLSVVDFKTSTREKKREWIHDYFLQGAAYSFMFEEMYGTAIEQVVILIACEESHAQLFIDNPYEHEQDPFFTGRL